ncbi:MAG TPA: DUF3574 domain-containing protein [Usitatibacter sp.]|nr:DUF3574 domain-containing protein [Usitatibacter sp.]
MRGLALLLALLLAACEAPGPLRCPDGGRAAVTETLFFGTDRPGGAVSDAQWAAFLGEVVAPRFPQGFTTWPASGQWRGASGEVVRERSFVLSIVHAPGEESARDVAAIASQYKSRFGQEAVLRVASSGCSSL